MSGKTTPQAFMKCPRKCPDCEEDAHCWRDYKPDRLVCKHCPAAISMSAKCKTCGHELIDHWNNDDAEAAFQCGHCSMNETGDGPADDACDCQRFVLASPSKRSTT